MCFGILEKLLINLLQLRNMTRRRGSDGGGDGCSGGEVVVEEDEILLPCFLSELMMMIDL